MKIFISYRSLDREAVRSIVDDLQDIGHEIWTDLNISGGQDWWENILEGIRLSDLFIFGLTRNWFESDACLREFDYATSLGKNRIPVKLSDEMKIEDVPQQVRRLQIVEYTPGELQSFKELQRAINRMPSPDTIPQPLPEPPASPMEPLAKYDQQLRQLQLQRDAQSAMVFELKRALRQQQSAEHARTLLQNLRKHPDTNDTIASRIDRALSESPEVEPEHITEEMMPIVPAAKTLNRPVITLKDVQHITPLATFTQHTDTVHAVAFSPDAMLLASASADRSVRLWNMLDGEPFAMLRGHNGAVRDVAFSPDGQTLASSAADSTVRLWGIRGNREIHELNGHTDWVLRVQFAPRGDVLASTSVDEMTVLWNSKSHEVLGTLGGHGDWVTGVVFSPDSTSLATASYDGTIRFWNVARRRRLHTMFSGVGMVEDVVFAPTGTILAAAFQDGKIRLYSPSRQREMGTLSEHHHTVYKLAFNPNGNLLASGGADGTIRIWNMKTHACCHTLEGHEGAVWGVAFSPDGSLIASSSEDGTVRLWGLVG